MAVRPVIEDIIWAARHVTYRWTTVLASAHIQRGIQNLAVYEHRSVRRPNGCVVSQYRIKKAAQKEGRSGD